MTDAVTPAPAGQIMTGAQPAAPAAEPTADELAAAQAVINRKMAADLAKQQAARAPLQELVNDAAFAPLLAKATELRGTVVGITPFFEHLNAIVTGMEGLARDAA